MAVGDGSSRLLDDVDLSSSIALHPESSFRVPTTVGTNFNLSTHITIRTTDVENGDRSEGSHADQA